MNAVKERLDSFELLNRVREAKMGDKVATSYLVQRGQPLILSRVKIFMPYVDASHHEDLIQEGNFGFLKAIYAFDEEKGNFVTFATSYIDGYIKLYLNTCNHPIKFSKKYSAYKKILKDCQLKGSSIPLDEEMCKLLSVSYKQLQHIKKESSVSVFSLDKKIHDGEDSSFHEIVPDYNNSIDCVINDMDSRNLLLVLKEVLTWKDYYILYYNYLTSDPIKASKIIHYFGISESYYRILKSQALDVAHQYIVQEKTNHSKILNQLQREYGSLENLNVLPVQPNDILRYLYVKDDFSFQEDLIYYMKYVERHDFSVKDFMNFTGFTKQEYLSTVASLEQKISSRFKDDLLWKQFREKTLLDKRVSIFDAVKRKKINSILLEAKYAGRDFHYLKEHYSTSFLNLSEKDQDLLRRYFSNPSEECSSQCLELEFNALFLPFHSVHISFDELYKVYLAHKNRFSLEQQMYIESHVFSVLSKDLFFKQYPDSSQVSSRTYYIYLLEKLYFKIPNFTDKYFDKKQYLEIRNHTDLDSKKREILDLYYGVDGTSYSTSDIKEKLGLSSDDEVFQSRDHAIQIYIGHKKKICVDKSKYIPYIKHPAYDFSPEIRKILTLYFCENYSYEEIVKELGAPSLTTSKISNIITDNIRKIDNYRFHIVEPTMISPLVFDEFFKYYVKKFTEEEIDILRLKYLQYKNNDEIAEVKKITKSVINRVVKKFNHHFPKFLVRDISVTKEDVEKELQMHPSESIIPIDDRKLMMMAYGIGTDIFSQVDIAQELHCSIDAIHGRLSKIKDNMKLNKIHAYRKDLCYIKRDDLKTLLNDSFVPLEEDEKSLISYLFEFNGYPMKSLKELESVYGINEANLRKKYQSAIVKLKRYEANEIAKSINFSYDIEPNLKYFCKLEQVFIEEYYQNKKTKLEISKCYSLPYTNVLSRFDKIALHLNNLLHYKDVKKFNFDLVETAVLDPYFPYYGNVCFMKQIYDLYFGTYTLKPMFLQDIIQNLNLKISPSMLLKKLYKFMIAVSKYEKGIRREFSDLDIQKYYDTHFSSMSDSMKNIFQDYFRKLSIHEEIFDLNEEMFIELLKNKYPNYISFSQVSKEEIICLLKHKDISISRTTYVSLLQYFFLRERDLFTKGEYHRVYQLLHFLEHDNELKKVLK